MVLKINVICIGERASCVRVGRNPKTQRSYILVYPLLLSNHLYSQAMRPALTSFMLSLWLIGTFNEFKVEAMIPRPAVPSSHYYPAAAKPYMSSSEEKIYRMIDYINANKQYDDVYASTVDDQFGEDGCDPHYSRRRPSAYDYGAHDHHLDEQDSECPAAKKK
ncbi:hypothetical protein ACOME3_005856 [Neoechinorhynchus agilis]